MGAPSPLSAVLIKHPWKDTVATNRKLQWWQLEATCHFLLRSLLIPLHPSQCCSVNLYNDLLQNGCASSLLALATLYKRSAVHPKSVILVGHLFICSLDILSKFTDILHKNGYIASY